MRKLGIEDLEALYTAPVPLSLEKVADHLTPLYQKWIEGSRFCILSTIGPEGVHGSPRGDDGPVVRVADAQTLMIPDWQGNNRLDCLRDIAQDGRCALLFLVPGSKTTVRVNGDAFLTDDADLRASFARKQGQPKTVIVLRLTQVYTQCAKALMRSGLWQRDDRDRVPTVGEIMAEMTKGREGGASYDAQYEQKALPRLW